MKVAMTICTLGMAICGSLLMMTGNLIAGAALCSLAAAIEINL